MEVSQTPGLAWWKRLFIIGVTVATVVSIYRWLDLQAFLETLRRVHSGWLLTPKQLRMLG